MAVELIPVEIQTNIVNAYDREVKILVVIDAPEPVILYNLPYYDETRTIGMGSFNEAWVFHVEAGIHELTFFTDAPENEGILVQANMRRTQPEAHTPIALFHNYIAVNAPVIMDINLPLLDPPTIEGEPPTFPPVYPDLPAPSVLVTNDPKMKPIIEAIGKVTGLGGEGFDPVGGIVSGIFGTLLGSLGGIAQRFLGWIPNLVFGASTSYADNIVNEMVSMQEGSPAFMPKLTMWESTVYDAFAHKWSDHLNVDTWLPTEPDLEGYKDAVVKMREKFLATVISDLVAGTAIEIGSLGQIEGFNTLFNSAISNIGVGEVMQEAYTLPIKKAILTPYEHYVNETYPTQIPPYTDLINMRVKEKITATEFRDNLARQGYSNNWANRIWLAHFQAPAYTEVIKAFYRGGMDYPRLLELMERVDLDPDYNVEVWERNIGEIPDVTELINQRVKEIIGDTEFSKYLTWHGYDPKWRQRIWDAHFMPPTLGDILTAYRRKIEVTIPEIDPETGLPKPRTVTALSLTDVHQLMKLVDLDERYNSIFDTRLYRDPTLREARYMFETGNIDPARVKDVVERSGLDPAYVDDMVGYLTSFTERAYQRRYLTALTTAYMNKVYDDAEVTKLVTDAGFTEGVAEWIIKTGEVRRKMIAEAPRKEKPRILTMAQLDKAYIRDVITDAEYQTRMMQLGYETLDIILKLEILSLDKHVEEEGSKVIRLTTAQLLNAWKQEVMTEDEVKIELALRGLDTLNITRLIETKKKQWSINGD